MNEQLKREISEILHFEAKDPRVGRVTVTEVEVSADLAYARVHVGIPGSEDEKEEALAGLGSATPFIRTSLASRLASIRQIPELRFDLDRTADSAARIEDLLAEVGLGRARPPAAGAEPQDAAAPGTDEADSDRRDGRDNVGEDGEDGEDLGRGAR